jgi:hypothetical protein
VESVRQGFKNSQPVLKKKKIINSFLDKTIKNNKKCYTETITTSYYDINSMYTWLQDNKILITNDLQLYLNIKTEIIKENLLCVTTNVDHLVGQIRVMLLQKPISFHKKHFKGEINNMNQQIDQIEVFLNKLQLQIPNIQFWLPKDNFFLDILTFVQSELLVLEDFIPLTKFKTINYFKFDDQFRLLENSFTVLNRTNYISSIKYHTAYLMAYALENELPKKPNDYIGSPFIWSGPIKYFLKNILNRKGKQAYQLGFTYLQGIKRGCQMVPQAFLDKAIIDHARIMQEKPKHNMNDIQDIFYTSVLSLPSRVKKFSFTKIYEPSHSSSYEKTNDEGGQYHEIIQNLGLEREPNFVIREGKVDVNYQYNVPKDIHDKLYELYLEQNSLDEINQRKLYTSVIPLSEPLKVRTITKAEALPSYLAKSFQVVIKDYINSLSSMVLTTRPLEINDFKDVYKKQSLLQEKYNFRFNNHVSGDYKSATDKLNINLTKLIFKQLLKIFKVEQKFQILFESVLYEQLLTYPKHYTYLLKKEFPDIILDDEGRFVIQQQNGQLMGSILSFPILCLANLICYKVALENYISSICSKKVILSYEELPVLINGDDIYFMTNNEFYKFWLNIIGIAGFELSIGKNYVHNKVFTINSQCFMIKNEAEMLIEEIGYLNLGLLINQSKSGILKKEKPVWDNYNKLTSKCFSPSQTHNNFLFYNTNLIKKITKNGNYNLFLPKLLGGLGFIKPEGVKVNLTHFQTQFASFLHNYNEEFQVPRFINEEESSFKAPFQGNYQVMKVPLYNVLGKNEKLKIGNSNPPFILQPIILNKLVYRAYNNDILRIFRKSKKNYTSRIFFSLDKAFKNQYDYQYIYKFSNNIEKDILDNRIIVYSKMLNIPVEEMFENYINNNKYIKLNKLLVYRRFRNLFKLNEENSIITGVLSEHQKIVILTQNSEYTSRNNLSEQNEQTNQILSEITKERQESE